MLLHRASNEKITAQFFARFMKNQFRLLIFSLVLMFLLGGFAQVSACSYGQASFCSSYNHAKYVFVGKVVKYEKLKASMF